MTSGKALINYSEPQFSVCKTETIIPPCSEIKRNMANASCPQPLSWVHLCGLVMIEKRYISFLKNGAFSDLYVPKQLQPRNWPIMETCPKIQVPRQNWTAHKGDPTQRGISKKLLFTNVGFMGRQLHTVVGSKGPGPCSVIIIFKFLIIVSLNLCFVHKAQRDNRAWLSTVAHVQSCLRPAPSTRDRNWVAERKWPFPSWASGEEGNSVGSSCPPPIQVPSESWQDRL